MKKIFPFCKKYASIIQMSQKALTKSKRNKLLIAHKLKENARFIDRIKAILLLNDGWSFSELSEMLFIDEKTARNYKRSYDEDGLDHLIKDNSKGRPINSESTLSSLKSIERRNKGSEKYAISNSARYYWTKDVQEYLKNSKIEMIHLPSYSANLNLIERLWKFFNKKVLYNKYFEDFKEASLRFFKGIKKYKFELETLLNEKVEFIGA